VAAIFFHHHCRVDLRHASSTKVQILADIFVITIARGFTTVYSVSICTFELVQQHLVRQYFYFCTSTAVPSASVFVLLY
jgi:hypothetical protein